MDKRYQVFVSSTYEDLQEERQEVMQALLELDCIPAGMELFPAADETQWSLIKRVIDECDYYVVIVGGRYGSCDNDDVGFTEKEYRYALEIGKPTIAFLHKDPAKIVAGKSEQTDVGKRKLAIFRSLLEKKLCKPWSNPSELKAVVITSLTQLKRTRSAIGWVRADELPHEDATRELLKLRNRVDELESELEHARTTPPKGSEGLAQGENRCCLRYSYVQLVKGFPLPLNAQLEATWDSLFAVVAPRMLNEMLEADMHEALNSFIKADFLDALDLEDIDPGTRFEDFWLEEEDFQTIKVQLRALGLIMESEKQRSLKDTQTYWTLTPYGDDVMTRLVAVRRSEEQMYDESVQLLGEKDEEDDHHEEAHFD